MPRYPFTKSCRAELARELAAVGIGVPPPGALAAPTVAELDGPTTWVTCDPEQFDAAAAVVAAHDAATLDLAAAALVQQDAGDLGKVRTAYQAIRNQSDQLRADAATMPATLTAAQVRNRLIAIENALADLGDATAALARYVGRRPG